MRDRALAEWRSLVRDRADREWRELPRDVLDELACHLAALHAEALSRGASADEARRLALDALHAASFVDLSRRARVRRFPGGHIERDAGKRRRVKRKERKERKDDGKTQRAQ